MQHNNLFQNINQIIRHNFRESVLALTLASVLFLQIDSYLPMRLQIAHANAEQQQLYAYLNRHISIRNPNLPQAKRQHLIQTIIKKAEYLQISAKIRIKGQRIRPVLFLTAIIQTESAFQPKAVSPVGARGYMQLMPATYIWLNQKLQQQVSVAHIFETEVNIQRGVFYFNYLLEKLGDIRMACLAYNAGPGNIQRGVWLESYWRSILGHYLKLQQGVERHAKDYDDRQQHIIAENSAKQRS